MNIWRAPPLGTKEIIKSLPLELPFSLEFFGCNFLKFKHKGELLAYHVIQGEVEKSPQGR